jgi:hypothetical protein
MEPTQLTWPPLRQEVPMHSRLLAVLSGLLLAACASAPAGSTDPALQSLRLAQLDEVYRRPGVDPGRWNALYVGAPEIVYDQGSRGDSRYRKAEDFELDEKEQRLVHEKLVQAIKAEWGKAPGWTLVDAPGPDVLVLQTRLTDFYLYAPLRDDYPGRRRTYTRESSRFVLDVRLLAPDGELLLESRDRRVTGQRDGRPLELSSSVFYWGQLSRNFQSWARQLRPALDAS